jgi:hypothetical protein
MAAIGLTACDSKTGTAAVVNGEKISESSVSDYLTANARPVPVDQNGQTIAPRHFVLQVLVTVEVMRKLLDETGGQPSADQLSSAQDIAAGGASEADLRKQIVDLGLKADFVDQYLLGRELQVVYQSRGPEQDKTNELLSGLAVSVNPRYGSWNAKSGTVEDLGRAQLPDAVNLAGPLPGDASSAPAQ